MIYALILLADEGGGRVVQIVRAFGVDWQHLLAQIVSFGIVCALLYRFAYYPVLSVLSERRRRIAEGLANADKTKVELARTETQRQEVIGHASTQATQMIQAAHTAAGQVRQQEAEAAKAEAAQIIQKAREAAALEREHMLAELKKEIGRLVVETTASVSGRVLTPEDQQRLTEATAQQIGV
jgi:F-type H+-transporting ATPase subunit b